MGRYGQGWANVGRSGWFRLIDHGWVTWIVGGCGYACRSMGWCGQIWARVSKSGQVLMGKTDRAGMGDMYSGWVLVCVQVCGWLWVGVGDFGQIWASAV